MTGWLVVNSFINSSKFQKLYEMLVNSFSKKGINLEIKRANEISLKVNEAIIDLPSFVLFYDKDIYLSLRLEAMGCKVFNNSKAILLCDNKILMYQELFKNNIRIPKTYIAPKTFENINYCNLDFLNTIEKELGYPMVFKEAYGSFGEQVYLVNNHNEAISLIKKIGYKDFLIQEYIKTSKGKDIRINVVNHKPVCSILRYNDFDFRSNISNGGKAINYEPNKEFLDLAIKASKALNLDFGTVDMLVDESNHPIVCELNSNPQFKSTFDVTNVDLSDYIRDYIISKL
ncbi:MAG: RimK family alpha-L-glutamate ligase [Candidatus Onthovivens sp.]|nr:RimK family alpha-L-glutamate ligase [Candidatus Onthovivens sp.]